MHCTRLGYVHAMLFIAAHTERQQLLPKLQSERFRSVLINSLCRKFHIIISYMTADYFPLPHSLPILDRDHSLNENPGFHFTPLRLPFYCTILRLCSEDRSINILGDFCLIFVSTVWTLTAEEESLLASRPGIWPQTCQLPKSYSVLGLDLLKAYKNLLGISL